MPVDITEYADLARSSSGHVVVAGQEPAQATQQVAIGGTSDRSNAFGTATHFVRVHADANCRIEFGGDAVEAAATSRRLPAGASEYFGVRPGMYLAVISSS